MGSSSFRKILGEFKMTIFIAHKTLDRIHALNAYNFLKERKIDSYLAELDKECPNQEDLTDYLCKQISLRDHLLVLITPNSSSSWWIPFETGVATQADKRISSVIYDDTKLVTLPDFLKKWPIIRTGVDFEEYAKLVEQTGPQLIKEAKSQVITGGVLAKSINSHRESDIFHALLKGRLKQ